MDFTNLETVMAFFGLASIVIASFADRLTEHMLREPHRLYGPNARAADHSN